MAKLKSIPSVLIALFTLNDLTILLTSSLEIRGKSNLKEFGKKFSAMAAVLGWLLKVSLIFFTVDLSCYWGN